MTLVILFLSPVKSCGGGHGISSKEEEVCPSSPKKERSMAMVIFLPSSIESCGGGHGICSREGKVCPSYCYEEERDDHGHVAPILSRKL